MMSAHVALFLFALFVTVLSAPTALDKATLLKNAQTAQALNVQFQNMSRTNKCNDGESACIDGQHAACTNSAWELTRCPGSRKCFALPSIRCPGAFIACTSELNALSIIQGADGTGEIFSTGGSNSTLPLPPQNPMDCTSPPIPTSTGVVPPGQPSGVTTFPTVTTTLSPEEAFSQLMSLLAAGASPVGTSSMSGPTPTSPPSSTSVRIPTSVFSSTVLPSLTSNGVPVTPLRPTGTDCDD